MDIEIEKKHIIRELLENKKGLPDSQNVEEVTRLKKTKISIKENCDRIFDRLNDLLNIPK